jgi:hypothetical protein
MTGRSFKARREGLEMDNLSQAYLMLKDVPRDYRVELPDFPLGWLDKEKRTIEGLREIASHLYGKTAAGRSSRSGFTGVTTEMEKQLIRNVIDLEQQVYVLNDVLQSAIQIIVTEHEGRISQRIKRAGIRAWSKAASFGNRLWESTIFKVLGGVSTIAFAIGVIVWLIHILRR